MLDDSGISIQQVGILFIYQNGRKKMSETKKTYQGLFRVIYLAFATLFLVGVVVQVYLTGMVVVAGVITWADHVNFGHMLGAPVVILLLSAYLGRIPKRMKLLSWLLFGVYFLQADVVIFMRGSAPLISALHPVLALIDFALALSLVRGAFSLARQTVSTQTVSTGLQNPIPD
jgi:hypothetical protein